MMVTGGKFEKAVNGRQQMIREEMREILAGKGLSVSRSYSLCTSEKLLRCVDEDPLDLLDDDSCRIGTPQWCQEDIIYCSNNK